jgi:hypothetical protein
VSLWSTTLGQHFLSTRYDMEYCRERVRQILHALGLRWRRVRHRHLQATPQEQAAFLTERHVLRAAWPEDRELLCVDEATVCRHPPLTAPWCLGDDVPEVPTGDDHTKGHVYGAVAPLTGRTHYHMGSVWGQQACAKFLRHQLHYYHNKRLLVVHDRGEQQKGPPVEASLRDAEGRLVRKPPPAYSPELNPEERLWKWLRRVVTHHHGFESLLAEIQALRDVFCYLAGRKEQVRRLCTIKTPESLLALL